MHLPEMTKVDAAESATQEQDLMPNCEWCFKLKRRHRASKYRSLCTGWITQKWELDSSIYSVKLVRFWDFVLDHADAIGLSGSCEHLRHM